MTDTAPVPPHGGPRMPPLVDVGAMTGLPPNAPATADIDDLPAYGITGGVASALASRMYDAARGNLELATTLQGRPTWRPCWTLTAGIGGEPDVRAQVDEGLRHGAVAFTAHPHLHDVEPGQFAPAWEELERRHVPLVLERPELDWEAIDQLAEAHPRLPVVIGLVGYRELRRLTPVFRRHPLLHLTTANFTTHRGIDWFTSTFGPERLLHASGVPIRDPGEAIGQLAWSGLTSEALELVCHVNAERVFHLPPPTEHVGGSCPGTSDAGNGTLRDDVRHRRPIARRVVDAHAHEGPYSLFHIPDPDAAGMIAVMDRTGVDMTVLCANRAIQQDARRGNDRSARAVDSFPDRLRAYAVVNPWQDPERELARISSDPRFVGIKVHPDLHEYPLTGARYRAVWEYSVRTGCPVLTHTWAGSPWDSPSMLVDVADTHGDVTVLIGHSGTTSAGFDEALETARRVPGARLEICGSFMNARTLRMLVDGAGADRVVFGSDFPFIDQRSSLGRVAHSDLTEAELGSVLSGTADALFSWRKEPRRAC